MDGIAVQSTNILGSNHASLISRSKNGTARKALGEITNVQKNVTFGVGKPSSSVNKPSQKSKLVNHYNTPSVTARKVPSTNGKSNALTPFKIHSDQTVKVIRKKKSKNSEAEIEYMAPCTDKYEELPVPAYLQRCMNYKPFYEIDLTPESKEIDIEEFTRELNDEILSAKFEHPVLKDDLDLTEFVDDFDDEALHHILDTDERLSLESLDEELRAFGLEVPTY